MNCSDSSDGDGRSFYESIVTLGASVYGRSDAVLVMGGYHVSESMVVPHHLLSTGFSQGLHC